MSSPRFGRAPGKPLAGSSALVTGATGGLGTAIAFELARVGIELILTSRDREALESLHRQLPGKSHRTIVADLTCERAVADLMECAGLVDVVIANAGVSGAHLVEEADLRAIEHLVQVNLIAPIALCAAARRSMLQHGGGHFVFVASLSAKTIPRRSALYAASKAGVRTFAQGIRDDATGTTFGVSLVTPGYVRDVGMFARWGGRPPAGLGSVSSEQVAGAVLRAIIEDASEIVVAPLQHQVVAAATSHWFSSVSRARRVLDRLPVSHMTR